MVDVNDREELGKFLRGLPRMSRTSIAARVALRVAPFAFSTRLLFVEGFDGPAFLLTCLRANLVSGVASTWGPETKESVFVVRSARSASFSASSAARAAKIETLSTARSTLSAAIEALATALADVRFTARKATRYTGLLAARSHNGRTAETSRSAAFAALLADCVALSVASEDIHRVFSTPLGPNELPSELSRAMIDFEETAPGTPWAFWARWYRGMLDGKPLDWDLQRRVALIDNAIWKAGPEAVAQEIERIERLFDLEREIAALKDMLPLRSALSSTGLIGDNGGPPLDDGVQRAVRGDFVLVWDQIEDLEAEIAKPEPSPGRLKAIAKTLWDVSLRIAAYCGGKIDLALTEASKEAGKAVVKLGAPIAAASLASQNESIQQVAKAIWAFVKTLPPG